MYLMSENSSVYRLLNVATIMVFKIGKDAFGAKVVTEDIKI